MDDASDLSLDRNAGDWDLVELRSVLAALDEGVIVVDAGFMVRAINAAGLAIAERPASEIVGRTVWELWPQLKGHEAERAYRSVMATRAPQALEAEFAIAGASHWLEMRIVPSRTGLACFYRDITARKALEAQLRDAEAQVRATQEATGIGGYEFDLRTQQLTASPNARRLFGVGDDVEPTMADVLARIHPDDRSGAMIAQDDPAQYAGYAEYRVVLPDGEVRWLGRQAGIVADDDGRPAKVVGAIRDITARRTSDEHVRFQARLLDNMGQAVIATDPHGTVVFWNRAAERLYGWTSEEAQGRNVLDLKTGPAEASDAARLLSALKNGEHWSGEMKLTRRDGSTFLAQVTDSPIFDAAGELVGIVGISSDVSRRKYAEDHLSMMVNELNHRVKNTLATVQSVAAQTLRGYGISKDVQAALTDRLVALSRAHDVLTNEHWTGGDLRDVVAQAGAPYAGEDGRRFSFHGPRVRLEPKTAIALALALHELATNAVKYGALSGAQGRVTVDWVVVPDDGENVLHLTWREVGGPPVIPPTRQGFGSRLLNRSLPAELAGSVDVDYKPAGVVCRMTARLAASIQATPRAKFAIMPQDQRWVVTESDRPHAEFDSQREAIAWVSEELDRLRLTGRGGTVVFQRS